MKSIFLINPRSGARRVDARAIIGNAGDTVDCQRKEDLDGIIDAAIAGGYEVVYAVGGDGTVHEIAKRLIGKPAALGIIPTGSGNGLARHLGIPLDPAKAMTSGREIIAIDAAEVNGAAFVNVMGVGLDAEIAHRFAASGTRGFWTYLKEGLFAFSEYARGEYEIEIGGAAQTHRALIVAVANSSQYGSDARIAPVASLQDGLLNLVIVEDVPIAEAPVMITRLFNGTIHESNHVKIIEAPEMIIRRPAAGPAHLDGEPVVLEAELRVRVLPGALKVLVPGGGRL